MPLTMGLRRERLKDPTLGGGAIMKKNRPEMNFDRDHGVQSSVGGAGMSAVEF